MIESERERVAVIQDRSSDLTEKFQTLQINCCKANLNKQKIVIYVCKFKRKMFIDKFVST